MKAVFLLPKEDVLSGENKQVVQGFFEEVINARRFDCIDTYINRDIISHTLAYVGLGFSSDFSDIGAGYLRAQSEIQRREVLEGQTHPAHAGGDGRR